MSNPPQPSNSKPIARLMTIRQNPDVNTITPNSNVKPKKEFQPNIPIRRIKKDESSLDSLLSGPITDLIKDSLTPLGSSIDKPKPTQHKFRPNINRNKNVSTPSMSFKSTLPLQGDRNNADFGSTTDLIDTTTRGKETDKIDNELLNQLFHEMEIDPMQAFHPTHLPLVDPRKVMKEYSLSDAKSDINKKKKELETKILNGELSDISNFQLENLTLGSETITSTKKKTIEPIRPFYNDGVFLNNNNLFFIQLPISLPSLVTRPNYISPLPLANRPQPPPPQTNAKPQPNISNSNSSIQPINIDGKEKEKEKEETEEENYNLDSKSFVPMVYPGDFPNTLKSLKSGKIGTLKIYKSGKTILTIGGVRYDVSSSDKLKFLEEVKCFTPEPHYKPEASEMVDPKFVLPPDAKRPTCYNLGTPSQHLVAAPIISKFKK